MSHVSNQQKREKKSRKEHKHRDRLTSLLLKGKHYAKEIIEETFAASINPLSYCTNEKFKAKTRKNKREGKNNRYMQ